MDTVARSATRSGHIRYLEASFRTTFVSGTPWACFHLGFPFDVCRERVQSCRQSSKAAKKQK